MLILGWVVYVHSRTLWVSPTNSPLRLGVSPAASTTPTGVFSQRIEALFPCAGTLGCSVCLAPLWFLLVYLYAKVGQPSLPAACCESSPPGCPSPPLLPVWMNVSSLTPWLLDFHTVQFSVSSGCFLFLNCYCPSFGCARRQSVSTYASILAGSSEFAFLRSSQVILKLLI